MLEPRIGNPFLAFRVAELGRRCAGTVCIDEHHLMQKSAAVNLTECFLGSVVGELFQLLAGGRALCRIALIHAHRGFSFGRFVEIVEIEAGTPCPLARKDHRIFHIMLS